MLTIQKLTRYIQKLTRYIQKICFNTEHTQYYKYMRKSVVLKDVDTSPVTVKLQLKCFSTSMYIFGY